MRNDELKGLSSYSAEEFSTILDDAIIGRLCVQAWLGYGASLFMGFGKEVLPPPTPVLSPTGRSYLKHAQPPYEIQTYSSDWLVKKDMSVIGSSFNNPEAEYAILSLVGTRATGWEFIHPSRGLLINFNSEYLIEITSKKNVDNLYSDAWGLRTPDNLYSVFRLNGDCYRIHEDVPGS